MSKMQVVKTKKLKIITCEGKKSVRLDNCKASLFALIICFSLKCENFLGFAVCDDDEDFLFFFFLLYEDDIDDDDGFDDEVDFNDDNDDDDDDIDDDNDDDDNGDNDDNDYDDYGNDDVEVTESDFDDGNDRGIDSCADGVDDDDDGNEDNSGGFRVRNGGNTDADDDVSKGDEGIAGCVDVLTLILT